jgi:hypothetical protein
MKQRNPKYYMQCKENMIHENMVLDIYNEIIDITKRIIQFDGPHPGNELYKYQIEKVKLFIEDIGEKEW